MDTPNPTPQEARASLEEVSSTRRATARATRRPVWIDLGMAITVGAATGFGSAGLPLATLAVLVLGSLGFTVAQRRLARSHGQLFDRRAVGARMAWFAVLFVTVLVLLQFGPPEWQPWYAIGVGGVTAAGSFAWLRWEDRYRVTRLGAGDYDPDHQR